MFFNLLFVLYPIAVLVVLLMPSTAAAFRGERLVSEESEELPGEVELEAEPWRQPPPNDKFRQ